MKKPDLDQNLHFTLNIRTDPKNPTKKVEMFSAIHVTTNSYGYHLMVDHVEITDKDVEISVWDIELMINWFECTDAKGNDIFAVSTVKEGTVIATGTFDDMLELAWRVGYYKSIASGRKANPWGDEVKTTSKPTKKENYSHQASKDNPYNWEWKHDVNLTLRVSLTHPFTDIVKKSVPTLGFRDTRSKNVLRPVSGPRDPSIIYTTDSFPSHANRGGTSALRSRRRKLTDEEMRRRMVRVGYKRCPVCGGNAESIKITAEWNHPVDNSPSAERITEKVHYCCKSHAVLDGVFYSINAETAFCRFAPDQGHMVENDHLNRTGYGHDQYDHQGHYFGF